MYLVVVVLLLAILPVLSIAAELAMVPGSDVVFTVGKWFVFWAVGVRLLLAGIRQMLNPQFTAETIFESKDPATVKVVTELGFGNLALGVLGTLALYQVTWVDAAALAGGLYYGLAGVKHATNQGRNRNQNIAMISDLAIFAVLAVYLTVSFVSRDMIV